jgi:hypothetical protein
LHSERIFHSVLFRAGVLGTVALVACGDDAGSAPTDGDAGAQAGRNLLAVEAFVSPEPGVDRDADERGAGCALGAPRVEDGTLEFETNDCVFFWAGVPLVSPVNAGERLTLVTTHGTLAARSPAEAHLRIDLDDEVIIDRTVPIPSPDAIVVDTITPARAHAAGSRLRVHLHNHGANSWRVVSLARR